METEEGHTEESEQMTTMEEENAPILASKFNEPTCQNDLPPPSENTNLVQPHVADLQEVGPSVENPNKWKHHVTHECVSEKQTLYNKKMKASRVKVDKFKIDDFVSIKIDQADNFTTISKSTAWKSYRS